MEKKRLSEGLLAMSIERMAGENFPEGARKM